jgi:acyl-coenzyme A thioesterase PaaI-like protein
MKDADDAAWVKLVTGFLSPLPFVKALGVEVVAATPGSVTLEAPLTPAFEAPPGAFAASAAGTLRDMAAMVSVTSALPLGYAMSTMNFTVKMLGQAVGPRLRAVGQARQIGKTTCVGAADIFVLSADQWTLCGTLLATGRRLNLV